MSDLKPGIELRNDGTKAGRDVRTMSKADLLATGATPVSLRKAIQAKCLDCCAGERNEVRLCPSTGCPLWPFRHGTNPWRPELSPEAKENLRERGLALSRLGKGSVKAPVITE